MWFTGPGQEIDMNIWIYILAPALLIVTLLGAVLFALSIYVRCAVCLCLWIAGLIVRAWRRLWR